MLRANIRNFHNLIRLKLPAIFHRIQQHLAKGRTDRVPFRFGQIANFVQKLH